MQASDYTLHTHTSVNNAGKEIPPIDSQQKKKKNPPWNHTQKQCHGNDLRNKDCGVPKIVKLNTWTQRQMTMHNETKNMHQHSSCGQTLLNITFQMCVPCETISAVSKLHVTPTYQNITTNASPSQRNTTTSFISVTRRVKIKYPLQHKHRTIETWLSQKNIIGNAKDRKRYVRCQHKLYHITLSG
jgi:hypothetical protein